VPFFLKIYRIFIISYIMSFGCEKVREILASEPVKLTHKIRVWAMDMWNACDALFVVELIIALIVRLQGGYLQEVGRVLYCLNIVYWY
jgi:transient receptor potential cation channel subfamily M protein 3